MEKQPAQKITEFEVPVEGVGLYVFRRRAIGDVYKIRTQYAQLTGGHYDEKGRMADLGALAFATIKVLAISEPVDFQISKIDPILDVGFDEKLVKVYFALSKKEGDFRPGAKEDGTGARAEDGGNVRAVVPQDLPAGAD